MLSARLRSDNRRWHVRAGIHAFGPAVWGGMLTSTVRWCVVCVWASILPFTHDHLLHTHTHAHMHRKVCTDKFGAGAKKTQFYESVFSHSYRRKFSHASARPETPPPPSSPKPLALAHDSKAICYARTATAIAAAVAAVAAAAAVATAAETIALICA